MDSGDPSTMSAPLGLQQDDVVRLVDTGELAFVEHVGGDTSEEEIEEVFEEDEMEASMAAHWQPHLAASSSAGAPPDRHFISHYDEDDDSSPSDSDNSSVANDDAVGDGVGEANSNAPMDTQNLSDGPPRHHPHHDNHVGGSDGEAPHANHSPTGEEDGRPGAEMDDLSFFNFFNRMHGDGEREEVPVGSARVSLIDVLHREMVLPVEKLVVEDRTFIPGDVVHRSLRYRVAASATREDTEGANSGADDVEAASDSSPQSQEQSAVVVGMSKTLIVRRALSMTAPPMTLREAEARRRVVAREPTFEISAESLQHLSRFRNDSLVVLDDWLGRVNFFSMLLVVRFRNGAMCRVVGVPDEVYPADVGNGEPVEDVEGVYFPGQNVRGNPRFWADAVWLSGRYNGDEVGEVMSTDVDKVGVDWIAKRVTDELNSDDAESPEEIVKALDLKPLVAFRHLLWRVGDRGLYNQPFPESIAVASGAGSDGNTVQHDENEEGNSVEELGETEIDVYGNENTVDGSDEWEEVEGEDRVALEAEITPTPAPPRFFGAGVSALRRQRHVRNGGAVASTDSRAEDKEKVVQVVNTRTYLDLLWQDGSVSKRVPAVSVLANHHLGAYDYFPGVFVSDAPDDLNEAEKTESQAQAPNKSNRRSGVVVRVNPEERTATVRWQVKDSAQFGEEEEVSVYELADGQYDIRLGDTVLRVPKPKRDGEPVESMEGRSDWVGEVTGAPDGSVRVSWVDGTVEEISPECLLVVHSDDGMDEDDDSDEEEDEDGEDSSSDSGGRFSASGDGATVSLADNWEGEGGAGAVWVPGVEDGVSRTPEQNAEVAEGRETTAPEATREGTGSADPMTSSISPSSGSPGAAAMVPEGDDRRDHEAGSSETSGVKPGDESVERAKDAVVEEELHAGVERFAMIERFERHHFESGSSSDRQPPAGFPMIVRKEWTRLSRHLPPGIFVHASEVRLDMLRAAIVGPSDTPYEHLLFFFDIVLPPDYPSTPPKVHFMAHGRRLSPNLYDNGKVCLSLLGTWDGDGVEKWDPRNSNLLRVLLSIQAMVLVDEPYYTEAGYEKQVGTDEGRTNSRLYNESALLLNLRHLVSTLRVGGAPEDFQSFARQHYELLGPKIVAKCQKLLSEDSVEQESGPGPSSVGAMGHQTQTTPTNTRENTLGYSSVGFRRSLAALLPKVEAALQANGPPAS